MNNKIRIKYAKQGTLAYTGHLDIATLIPKLLRRCNLELAFSQGFSPRPKMVFTLPLPLGCESKAEFCDAELVAPITDQELTDVKEYINRLFPDFPFILNIRTLVDEKPINQRVEYVCYQFTFDDEKCIDLISKRLSSEQPFEIITKDDKPRDILFMIKSFSMHIFDIELICLNNGENVFPPQKFANTLIKEYSINQPKITKIKLLDKDMLEIE